MDIQAAKKRCEAARGLFWVISADETDGFLYVETQEGTYVCETGVGNRDQAEFIAHARSDLPAALEALEEAQVQLEIVRRGYHTLADQGGMANIAIMDLAKERDRYKALAERVRREVAWLETACANEDKSFDMFDVLERFRAAVATTPEVERS